MREFHSSVVGYASFVENGIVPVLLNGHLEKELLDNLIINYKPKFIWTRTDQLDNLKSYGSNSVYDKYGYSLLKTEFGIEYPLNDELCLKLTTSGSPDSPKFVRQKTIVMLPKTPN